MQFNPKECGNERIFVSWCLWPRKDPLTGITFWLQRVHVEKHLIGSNVYGDDPSWQVVRVWPF